MPNDKLKCEQAILSRTLDENNLQRGSDHLSRLKQYIDVDIPSFHTRVSSLAKRLETVYVEELEQREGEQPTLAFDEEEQDFSDENGLIGPL